MIVLPGTVSADTGPGLVYGQAGCTHGKSLRLHFSLRVSMIQQASASCVVTPLQHFHMPAVRGMMV